VLDYQSSSKERKSVNPSSAAAKQSNSPPNLELGSQQK